MCCSHVLFTHHVLLTHVTHTCYSSLPSTGVVLLLHMFFFSFTCCIRDFIFRIWVTEVCKVSKAAMLSSHEHDTLFLFKRFILEVLWGVFVSIFFFVSSCVKSLHRLLKKSVIVVKRGSFGSCS